MSEEDLIDTRPRVEHRPEVPTVGITESLPMDRLAELAHRMDGLMTWLDDHGLEPAGPPFFRYHRIDMQSELLVEAGIPVQRPLEAADGDVAPGTLPDGRYAVTIHHGPPAELADATAGLLDWAEAEGLDFDVRTEAGAEDWGCRLENYLSDPTAVPPNDWDTELAFRLAG